MPLVLLNSPASVARKKPWSVSILAILLLWVAVEMFGSTRIVSTIDSVNVQKVSSVEPSTSKEEWCAQNVAGHRDVLDRIDIAAPIPQEQRQKQRVLCMITTISPHHATRVAAAKATWGTQCDKWVVISNATDPSLGAVHIPLTAYDHAHLWEKTRKGLAYVWERYGSHYDWFYKADDDGFVVMENLHSLLASPAIQTLVAQGTPIQLGHRYSLPPEIAHAFLHPDPSLWKEFQSKYGVWKYNAGGCGYVMNRVFVERFVRAMNESTCLPGSEYAVVGEDAAVGFCMAWEGAKVVETRDELERQRFHFNTPGGTYHYGPLKEDDWIVRWHTRVGGYQNGEDCCSNESIAFHYVSPNDMYYTAAQLYYCRRPDLLSLEEFNAKTTMYIPPTLLPLSEYG